MLKVLSHVVAGTHKAVSRAESGWKNSAWEKKSDGGAERRECCGASEGTWDVSATAGIG